MLKRKHPVVFLNPLHEPCDSSSLWARVASGWDIAKLFTIHVDLGETIKILASF